MIRFGIYHAANDGHIRLTCRLQWESLTAWPCQESISMINSGIVHLQPTVAASMTSANGHAVVSGQLPGVTVKCYTAAN